MKYNDTINTTNTVNANNMLIVLKSIIYDLFIYIVWKRKIFYILYNIMNVNERIQLQKMLQEGDSEDYTEKIREVKHSEAIKRDIIKLQLLHVQYMELKESNVQAFNNKCIEQCPFLYNNYTDIFHKLKNGEINVQMLMDFVRILKKIEDGQCDQHEASYEVGTILKKIYVDSALRKTEKQDKEDAAKKEAINNGSAISWAQFKQQSK